MTLRYAQNAFENGDYGKALSLAEKAKDERIKVVESELKILEQTQKIAAVRKAGDSLDDIMSELRQRNQAKAIDVIENYVDKYGKDRFSGKYSVLKDFIIRTKNFPESDFLIGKIYRLEGETSVAEDYMNKAYDKKDILNVPDLKYDILYELAEISKDKHDNDGYERYFKNILKDDKYYADEEPKDAKTAVNAAKASKDKADIENSKNIHNKRAYMNSIVRLIKTNRADSVEKFFLMYRNDSDISTKALAGLSDFYFKQGQNEKALRCSALGCITALTKIEEILKDRLTDYSYTSFADLLKNASAYSDVVSWGNKNGIWQMYFNFAEIANSCGCKNFAQELFSILKDYEPESYWRNRAERSYEKLTGPAPLQQ
ncbi:MAG: hypothetical protein II579_01080 [Treponema sp.]|nr:hypothetical protein [Treponema sp.]MBQ1869906.1 hypothetical protein [Treponema sp.]MBQ2571039.1 hypothetical protein [Treponema sp.]